MMDRKDGEYVIDIEKCVQTSEETGNLENVATLSSNSEKSTGDSVNTDNNTKKEKRKSTSAKKPPKPPRPPRGLSLDAADQKLMREIHQLAMIKRARIERLKKMKAAKQSASYSSPSSSCGNFIAMAFTIIFCIIILFQGICPKHGSSIVFHGSPEPTRAIESSFAAAYDHLNFSTSDAAVTSSAPYQVKPVTGSDSKELLHEME